MISTVSLKPILIKLFFSLAIKTELVANQFELEEN